MLSTVYCLGVLHNACILLSLASHPVHLFGDPILGLPSDFSLQLMLHIELIVHQDESPIQGVIWRLRSSCIGTSCWWKRNDSIWYDRYLRMIWPFPNISQLMDKKNAATRPCKAILETFCKEVLVLFHLSITSIWRLSKNPCATLRPGETYQTEMEGISLQYVSPGRNLLATGAQPGCTCLGERYCQFSRGVQKFLIQSVLGATDITRAL